MKTGRESDQFLLRLPEGLRGRIKETAGENFRTMNAEIVFRLSKIYLSETEKADALAS